MLDAGLRLLGAAQLHVTCKTSFDSKLKNADVEWHLPVAAPSMTLSHSRTTNIPLLNNSFSALSDATRRGVLEQLGKGDASITALAKRFQMTLTGMKKHIGVLEQAGLVTTEKVGRVRTCKAGAWHLEEEAAWIESYRQVWEARFADLDNVIEELKKEREYGEKERG